MGKGALLDDEEVPVEITTSDPNAAQRGAQTEMRHVPLRDASGRTAAERDACGIGFVADANGRSSHRILSSALSGLANVRHRGALNADAKTADGSGLLLPLAAAGALFGGSTSTSTSTTIDHHLGVAMLFVRGDVDDTKRAVERIATDEGIEVVDWRTPPTDDHHLGRQAVATRPAILQAVFRRASSPPDQRGNGAQAERAAYRLRRRIDRDVDGTYAASCSFRTIVYKGLVAADAIGRFYLDLTDERFKVPFAIFHQRFATNTMPTWERSQPFRMLCHNGEINAIAGNVNRMTARATLGTELAHLGDEELFHPLAAADDSDSGTLDAAVELLTKGGRDVRHAVAMLVPEAWEGARDLDPARRGFYRYHSCLVEPWDGPAGLVFSDGLGVGAALDRNGLRPLRYQLCEDGLVVCCSEVGAVDVTGHGKVTRGRLGPGEMLFVDPSRGVLLDADCKDRIAAGAPYARWAADGLRALGAGTPLLASPDADDLTRRHALHGYTDEELRLVLRPMAQNAKEPTYSMGDDSPLPHVAGWPRPVHHYLKQRFAQVTNPPIDHLRERLVMSLQTLLGPRQPILTERPEAACLVSLPTFLLFPDALADLTAPTAPFPSERLDLSFAVADGAHGLRAAVARLCDEAERLVRDQRTALLVLDDSDAEPASDRAPVPSLLAAGAVHHRLVRSGLRSRTSLVVVADDARDVHHVACLLGYGADAICPRLALTTAGAEADADDTSDLSGAEAQENLQAAMEDGVLKILSKMGISTVDSYRGAQIFEVIGLGAEVVDVCFTGTPSVIGGIGWDALGEDVLVRHAAAKPLSPGYFRDKGAKRGGEYHTHNKEVVDALQDMAVAHLLQKALRSGDDDAYRRFASTVNGRTPVEVRDFLEIVDASAVDRTPVRVEEVEPVESIVQRFSTGAMSHGSLSREAHETLAEAMNLLGGKSNCGEGGEDPSRYRTRGQKAGDRNSKIKQIASGRFGVTPEYCAFADELQIKMAQGSKPGEGGQLPGNKVSDEIARLRHTQPGVTLISPPPHHDIYSIEDLAQLIFDLKQVNAYADVSVKLVAEEGVGTIAAGVVKALADVVQISGCNGGTGASPLSSIKHAGMPWELGLAETQQVLVSSGLRDRVRLRVDGGFMTGRDVLMAALLGADEFSFGTAAMIAEGCIMLRSCHKDTCKPGIATQRPDLRANFAGTAEGVATYLCFVAQEVREGLAALGFHSLDEAIGRVECLAQRAVDVGDGGDARAASVDLSPLLVTTSDRETARCYVRGLPIQRPRSSLGDQLVADAFHPVWDGEDVRLAYPITNADRTVGAALGGAIALEFGSRAPRGTAHVRFDGAAGQSFGAFLTDGAAFELVGEANDYVGKGMSGGRGVIRPPADDAGAPVLAGNTCLYGATGGELFVAGSVGERFGVRNSGAVAVVEGAGDHACEYMTGGTVVILGPVGYNVGAGMTGGQAFVLDPSGDLAGRVNTALVQAARPDSDAVEEARWLVERHAELTGSVLAASLLSSWSTTAMHLRHVLPLERARHIEAHGITRAGAAV
jgi:glutamate synthase domain-containing protein 2/glutamate synthase domain-containing protein 1/glutamate synthase domain-containing protein 3